MIGQQAGMTISKLNLDYTIHSRLSEEKKLIYPVLSRRSGGLSLGINVNPDKKCSFHCIYCQVDRTTSTAIPIIAHPRQILQELEEWLMHLGSQDGEYRGHALMDIAIAGDGEPTLFHDLQYLITEIIDLKTKMGFTSTKLVLFTNGSNLDQTDPKIFWPKFFENKGEVWIKLDSWNPDSLKQINRSSVSFEKIMENIQYLGTRFPIVFQSCFFRWDNQEFNEVDLLSYINRIQSLLKAGVMVTKIQAYTLARKPLDKRCLPWSNQIMDRISGIIREQTDLDVQVTYESSTES